MCYPPKLIPCYLPNVIQICNITSACARQPLSHHHLYDKHQMNIHEYPYQGHLSTCMVITPAAITQRRNSLQKNCQKRKDKEERVSMKVMCYVIMIDTLVFQYLAQVQYFQCSHWTLLSRIGGQ